jgi:hypothetical protein
MSNVNISPAPVPVLDAVATVARGADELAEGVRATTLSAEVLFGRYCALVFHRAGSLREAAHRLGTDTRTVKARIDHVFLDELRAAR